MQRYEKYKDSGVEWIGEIPVGWKVKKLKRLSLIKRGASPRPIADPKYFDNYGKWAWVRIADVSASERYLENTTQTLSELGASLSVKMLPNSFFLSIAGTVGKPIITKIKCCIHDGFVYFPCLSLNPEFLYYIFSTGQPYKGLGKLGTQLNLNTDTVGDITIPIPSTETIEEITNYLDRKTAEIDQLIVQKVRLLCLYEEEKTAIINQAVTQGINPDVKLKDSGIDWLGEIPEHWEVKKFKYLLDLITDKNKLDLPKIGLENIESKTGNHIESTTDFEGDGIHFINNDILFGKLRPYLAKVYLAEFEGKAVGDFYVFRCKNEINEKYASSLILSKKFIDVTNGSTFGSKMPRVAWGFIANLGITYPKIEEQTTIVQHIKTQTTRINAKISKTKKIIALQKEYRTALISEVVTGKIRVTQEMAL